MKKILALAVATVALSGSAFAQTASSNASVTATVVVPLTVTKLNDMAFGNLSRNVANSIQAGPGTASDSRLAATFRFIGDEGDKVFFTFQPNYTLVLNGAPNNAFAQVPGVNVADGQASTLTLVTDAGIRHLNSPNTAIPVTSVSPGGVNNPHNLSIGTQDGGEAGLTPGMGQMYLYIGGTITPAIDQQRGNYTGTIAVSADYVN